VSVTTRDERSAGAGEAEIDFVDLLNSIWRRRLLIATLTAVGVIGSLIYLRMATFTYEAELQVTAAQSTGTEGFSGALGGLQGLASIAGLSLPTGQDTSQFQLYLAGLTSRDVANVLARDNALMPTVFRSEWDPTRRTWKSPGASPVRNFIKSALGMPLYPWRAPDGARLQEYIEAAVKIEQNPKSPVVKIHMDHPDPVFATRFLAKLHRATDERLRAKALARANEYIGYLSAKLTAVTVAEHRLAIAQALSEQEKVRMMTSATTPFAAEPFGDATASLRATKPVPVLVLVSGLIGGLVLGLLAAVLLNLWTGRNESTALESAGP
jgi:uncharacterized protein involved in exopolysaccharide biosynthesis